MKPIPFLLALSSSLWIVASASAPAQAGPRAWVSGVGTDQAGCGSAVSPCRTPQYAHDNIVAAGGEIDIIDPAGYGTITITKAISIVNDGVGTAGFVAAAGGNAITINAGPNDAIQLRGLTIEGAGIGYNGIVFNSGASLLVANCVVQNFINNGTPGTTGNGILITPTSGTMSFSVTDTIVSNNGYVGVYYRPSSGSPSANGIVEHVTATANQFGIGAFTVLTSGGSAVMAVSNSVASNNTNDGFVIQNGGGTLLFSIDNVSAVGNKFGIFSTGNTVVLLGRSVITGNSVEGVHNGTSSNTFYTYGDNRIDRNVSDISSALNSLPLH